MSALTSHRIGPGHYEVRVASVPIGWLFDDSATRKDGEPWRFSPATLHSHPADAFATKGEAIAALTCWATGDSPAVVAAERGVRLARRAALAGGRPLNTDPGLATAIDTLTAARADQFVADRERAR